MDLAPGSTFRITVLSDLPFAFSIYLDSGRVKNYVQLFARFQKCPQRNLKAFSSTTKYRIMGTGEIETKNCNKRCDESLKSSKRYPKYGFDHQAAPNRIIRISIRTSRLP